MSPVKKIIENKKKNKTNTIGPYRKKTKSFFLNHRAYKISKIKYLDNNPLFSYIYINIHIFILRCMNQLWCYDIHIQIELYSLY